MKWLKLKWQELRINHGEHGWPEKYKSLCHERNAETVAERLKVAEEVIAGGATSMKERWWYSAYLKNHNQV